MLQQGSVQRHLVIVQGRDLLALIRATSKVCSSQENLFGVGVE